MSFIKEFILDLFNAVPDKELVDSISVYKESNSFLNTRVQRLTEVVDDLVNNNCKLQIDYMNLLTDYEQAEKRIKFLEYLIKDQHLKYEKEMLDPTRELVTPLDVSDVDSVENLETYDEEHY